MSLWEYATLPSNAPLAAPLSSSPPPRQDLKPANILLDGSDDAKVADFGTVREDKDKYRNQEGKFKTSANTHASTKVIVGTTPYMPNEYTRKGHVSEKTDAYALGVRVSACACAYACAYALCFQCRFPDDDVRLAVYVPPPSPFVSYLSLPRSDRADRAADLRLL